MIRSFLPITILFLFLPVWVFSQTVLPEATLTYDFSVSSEGKSTPLDTNISGQQIIVYLKGTMSRMDNINSAGRESSVFDARAGSGFLTREYSGQRLLVPLTAAEWQEQHSFYSKLRFSDDDGFFPVQGYSCRKTKELKPPDKIYAYTVYYDPLLQMPNKGYELSFPQLGGLPVLVEMRHENKVYRLLLTGLNQDAINPSVFEIPRKGYKTVGFAEFKALKRN